MATYSDIVTRLKAFTEDDDTEFDSIIGTIIESGEQRISYDLMGDYQRIVYTGTLLAQGEIFVNKPSTWIDTVALFLIDSSGSYIPLQKRDVTALLDYHRLPTYEAEPEYYADWDIDSYRIAPAADTAYTLEAHVRQRITGLSVSTTTTWLSLNYPDLLLYACLAESSVFHIDANSKPLYEQEYMKRLEAIRQELSTRKYDAMNNRGT